MIVSGCSARNERVLAQIITPSLPAESRRICAKPVTLPDRAITSREVTSLWGQDRAALSTCEARRSAAVKAVDAVPLPAPKPGADNARK
jgi:hypothetical protein